jgi:methionyl-tRNA synthetase
MEAPPPPPPPAPPPGPAQITFDDFAKIDLRVATVLEARPHTKGTRLLVLKLDLGTEQRQICAGIRQHVTPESLIGKQIIIVANLAPREMLGEVSQGMLLAASDPSGKVVVLSPPDPVPPGTKVS